MKTPLRIAAVVAVLGLAGALSACTDRGPPTFQGWIEANLIFVGPDEAGRVEALTVREGDKIEAGAPLFSVDTELQRADLMMNEASLKNAQQAHDRALKLLKTSSGTEKAVEDTEMALRSARKIGKPRLLQGLQALQRADGLLKGGADDPRVAMEFLIVELTGPAARSAAG